MQNLRLNIPNLNNNNLITLLITPHKNRPILLQPILPTSNKNPKFKNTPLLNPHSSLRNIKIKHIISKLGGEGSCTHALGGCYWELVAVADAVWDWGEGYGVGEDVGCVF